MTTSAHGMAAMEVQKSCTGLIKEFAADKAMGSVGLPDIMSWVCNTADVTQDEPLATLGEDQLNKTMDVVRKRSRNSHDRFETCLDDHSSLFQL